MADYDDYDMGDMPGMPQGDPFADYDYETLAKYYEEFKNTQPQMAQMIKMGMMKKKQQMNNNPNSNFGNHGKLQNIKQFNEKVLIKSCVAEQAIYLWETLKLVFLAIIIFRVLKCTVLRFFSQTTRDLITAALGVVVLQKVYGDDVQLILPILVYYISLYNFFVDRESEKVEDSDESNESDDKIEKRSNNKANITLPLLLNLAIILLSEFYFPDQNWAKVRGTNMIISMKLLTALSERVQLVTGLGYILHPATVIYGPWTSIKSYLESYNYENQKLNSIRSGIFILSLDGIKRMMMTIFSIVLAVTCFILSNCVTPYLFSDPYLDEDDEEGMRSITGWHLSKMRVSGLLTFGLNWQIWFYAFEVALTFRLGWYYVAFLSNSLSLLSDQNNSNSLFAVCNPFTVEFPTCISSILTDWNRPIAEFLKNYVYYPLYSNFKKKYEKVPENKYFGLTFRNFYPILTFLSTFIVSALFHGGVSSDTFNISIILLSLGLISYVQYNFRRKLAYLYDNPGLAPKNLMKNWKNEEEDNNNNLPKKSRWSRWILTPSYKLIFLLINYIHLVYLGYLMVQDSELKHYGIRDRFRIVYTMFQSLHFLSWKIFGVFFVFMMFT